MRYLAVVAVLFFGLALPARADSHLEGVARAGMVVGTKITNFDAIVRAFKLPQRAKVGLAKEVAAEGIRVNAVRPGLIDTDIHASGGEPGRIARLAPNIPMQRGGEPEEVAEAILWLASPQASYVTGTLVNVSGGR